MPQRSPATLQTRYEKICGEGKPSSIVKLDVNTEDLHHLFKRIILNLLPIPKHNGHIGVYKQVLIGYIQQNAHVFGVVFGINAYF